ncbi:MAG: hypothetical protein ACTHMC_03505 [Pseudobacter sp.]|uniref:hypothetical protein n=1 Tax=Pseudobacter sp. TaxID=2045420 RepID=UPI003F823DDB
MNTTIPVKKMELAVITPVIRKEATVIPLQPPVSEPTNKMNYIMPPQPQGYFKGRDNDCL